MIETVWGHESKVWAVCYEAGLAPPEREVVLLALAGMNVRETARFLYLSVDTIRYYRSMAYQKIENCYGVYLAGAWASTRLGYFISQLQLGGHRECVGSYRPSART